MIRLTLIFSILISLAGCSKFQSHDNLYPVSIKGKMGFIDSLGNVVIECKFDYVGKFSDGLAIAVIDSMYGYIDMNGAYKIDPTYNIMEHIIAGTDDLDIKPLNLEKKQKLISHMRSKPDTVFNYDIPSIFNFNEGRVVYRSNRVYGYLNTEGEQIIKAQYAFAKEFSEGLAAVKVKIDDELFGKSLYGYIDNVGKSVIDPQYTLANNFSEGKSAVAITYNYQDEVSRNNLYNIKTFVINQKGQILFTPEIQALGEFQHGYAGSYSMIQASLYGVGTNYIDSTGKYYLPDVSFLKVRPISNITDSINYFNGRLFLVQNLNKKWAFLPEDLSDLSIEEYDKSFKYEDAYPFSGNLARIKINNKWGYIDPLQKIVIEPIYTDAKGFKNGLAYVEQTENGFKLKGYINTSGVMVWSTKEY